MDPDDPVRVLIAADVRTAEGLAARLRDRDPDDRFAVRVAETLEQAVAQVTAGAPIHCVVGERSLTDGGELELLECVRDHADDRPFLLLAGDDATAIDDAQAGASATHVEPPPDDADGFDRVLDRLFDVVEERDFGTEGRDLGDEEPDLDRADATVELAPIVEHSNDGIITIDEESTIRFANEAVARIFGYPTGELVGESLTTLMADSIADRHLDAFDRYLRTRERTLDWGRTELPGRRRDGSTVPLAVSFAEFERDDGHYFTGIVRDVSDEVARDRELRVKDRAMDEANLGILITDPSRPDNPIVYANDGFEALTGYAEAEILGRNCRFLQGPETDPGTVADLRAAIDDERPVSVEILNYRTDGTPFWNELRITPIHAGQTGAFDGGGSAAGDEDALDDDMGDDAVAEEGDDDAADDEVTHFVGFQQDVTERKRREDRIAALNDLLVELMEAESTRHVATVVAETAGDRFDLPLAEVALVDEDSGTLRPVARTKPAQSHLDETSLLARGDGLGWEVFVSGDPTSVNLPAPDLVGESAPGETLFVAPLGRHGVFVAAAGSDDGEFVRTVAESVRGALDRVSREELLTEREARLAEQNEWLDRVNRVNEVIRSIDQALVRATTRREIERAVCRELARVDAYAFTWIGEHDSSTGAVEPREWDGDGKGYLEAATGGADDDRSGRSPTDSAADAREPQVVDDVIADPPHEPWREAAMQRGFRSAIALPLVYRDSLYGVLTVYASRPDLFDDLERQVLTELGETIAYALNAVESKRALVSDEIVELELDVDATDHPLMAFIEAGSDRSFELKGIVPAEDDGFRVYYVLRGASPEEITEFTDRAALIRDARLITDRDGDHLFESVLTEDSLVFWLLDRGAVPRSLSFTADGGRIRLELSRDADLREFVQRFRSEYPDAEVVATRERERPVYTRDEFEAAFETALTPRQREVLRTAYYSGYFETPRQRTGEDVANSLGVSQPTFSDLLRAGQRNLFELLFANDGES